MRHGNAGRCQPLGKGPDEAVLTLIPTRFEQAEVLPRRIFQSVGRYEARVRFLAIMQEQAERMARLVDDLLSLSRIELNAHLQPNTPVDLAPLRDACHDVSALATDARGRLYVLDRGGERVQRFNRDLFADGFGVDLTEHLSDFEHGPGGSV